MDFNQVELEQDDAAHMNRIGSGVCDLFNTYKFYYIKDFPVRKLVKLFNADIKGLGTPTIASKFYNLDYRMLEHWDDTEWIDWFTRAFYYLVTSFDQEGIKVPLNLYENQFFHPGGKRVCIGTYLGMTSVPVLLQTKNKFKKFTFEILSHDELQRVYPSNNFTAFIRDIPGNFHPLEIHYLESMIKTRNNIDGWMERAQGILQDFNIIAPPLYFLEHGLNIVNPDLPERTRVELGANGYEYKTIFTKKPKSNSEYFIKLNDTSMYTENFWKLVYYFDPRYRVKYSKKKELELRNTHKFATKEMKSSHMLKTLTRTKVMMPVAKPASLEWKLKV